MKKFVIVTLLILMGLAASAAAESDFYKEFKKNYGLLDLDLLNNPAEFAEIKNFVYEKDVATFTLEDGIIYLLRYVKDRPTTAFFIGKGHAHIDIPSDVERNNLRWCSGDSVVDEDFDFCFIRMADDFDLKLKEKFNFIEKKPGWKHFNVAKQNQGEVFFKPVIEHEYDNYFQLLRSCYERGEDGYFWVDFNRYGFNYDPNRPEQVIVLYEHEGGDQVMDEAAVFQKKANNVYDNYAVSNIPYPTTMLSRDADLTLGGMDGKKIDKARVDVKFRINRDSLKFVSMFLHYHLDCDSILYRGKQLEYWRRNDFTFMGLILPEYHYKGDTIDLTFFYSGKDYMPAFPFVKDLTPTPYKLKFNIFKGYNCLMPGMSAYEEVDGRYEFTADPENPYNNFCFLPYASGFDTVEVISDIGVTLNLIKSKEFNKNRYDCFIPDENYQSDVTAAFNFASARLGVPTGGFFEYIFPDSSLSMPGLICIPQIYCEIEGTGGLSLVAGYQVGRQWFGSLMKPVSYRDLWLKDATAYYLGLMHIQDKMRESNAYYSELAHLRDQYLLGIEDNEEFPLAATRRVNEQIRIKKGAWVIHMLRYLMYDLDTFSDRTFLGFLRDLSTLVNSQMYTNKDVKELAEKYYGKPLDWFFREWLFNRLAPKYKVNHKIEKKDDGYYVNFKVKTEDIPADYDMPIIMRVEYADGRSFHRVTIDGEGGEYSIGPLAKKPTDFHFNEFFSVLTR